MTNEEALDLIQHKLDLAVDDALIMTDKEYEVFSLCAKALEKEVRLDKIRAEIEELPTTECRETCRIIIDADDFKKDVLLILDEYKAESED